MRRPTLRCRGIIFRRYLDCHDTHWVGCCGSSRITYLVPQQFATPNVLSLLSTPVWALSVMRVTPGVGVAGRLYAILGKIDHRLHAHRRHLQRVLLRGGRDLAINNTLHAAAAAVDGDDE